MTVPGFSEIGKNAWDIFRTGYHYGSGIFKMSVTNKSSKNLELSSNYAVNCESQKVEGNAEAKLDIENFGNLKQKWSSDGTLTLECTTEGKPVEGLTLSTGIAQNPLASIYALKFGAKFKNDLANLGCSVCNTLDKNFRIVGTAVFGSKDLCVGYQAGYDTEMKSMTMNDIGLAYNYDNVGIHLRCTSIPYEYGASIFYKVNENVDTAINGIIARRDDCQNWTVGIGTRLKLDENTTLRLKLNKDRQCGVSMQQKMWDFVKLTLSFNLDLNNLPRGDHKVGLAVDIDGV